MRKKTKILFLILAIVLLPIVGYVVSYAGIVGMPPGEKPMLYHGLMTLVITLFLLAIPYAMLLLLSRAAHKVNRKEKELRFRDIPKDKDQLHHVSR